MVKPAVTENDLNVVSQRENNNEQIIVILYTISDKPWVIFSD